MKLRKQDKNNRKFFMVPINKKDHERFKSLCEAAGIPMSSVIRIGAIKELERITGYEFEEK